MQGYNYVMNETFIGKGIKMVGNFISDVSDRFYKNTWLGQKLSAAKEWFDNTAVGKFVGKLAPVLNIAGILLGGVGGFVGQAINTASKVVNIVRNPASLIDLPIVNRLKQSGIYQKCS
jgi:hypothetical protein